MSAPPPGAALAEPQTSSGEEDALVAAARAGDEAAFAEIHERYAPRLESYCTRLLGSREEAEDAVQQTFLKAHQSLQQNTNEIALAPWLYTIARNESYTILRARQRRPIVPLELEQVPPVPDAGEMVEAREALRETLRDLDLLPSEQRDALVRTSVNREPSSEIARSLGCEPAKVKSLVFRARAHLTDIRVAREMPCEQVRAQMRDETGGALRRRVIREHLRNCDGCAELAGRPRQDRNLALSVALWPLALLKGIGVGAAGSSGVGFASGAGAKAVTAALAVAATAGGLAANHDSGPEPAPDPARAERAAAAKPAAAAVLEPTSLIPAPAVRPPGPVAAAPRAERGSRARSAGRLQRSRADRGRGRANDAGRSASGRGARRRPPASTPAAGLSSRSAAPAVGSTAPPPRPASPPGKPGGAASPGHSQPASAPGRSKSAAAPGHSRTAPQRSSGAATPAPSASRRGRSVSAPGQSRKPAAAPGRSPSPSGGSPIGRGGKLIG